MTNPKIDIGTSFDAGAVFVYINGHQCHIPFMELTPHVLDLLALLDRAAIDQYEEEATDEHGW